LTAALLCGTAAVLATVGLAAASPAPFITFWLALLAIFLAWSYSSPPLWLNRRGLGEITGALLVPGLTTLLAFQVQAGQLALLPLLAVIPLCLFQLAMLLSVNFPDAFGDTQVYKRTLIVKYGVRWTERLFAAALVVAYVLTPVLVWFGLPGLVGLALLMTAPIAVWQGWRIRQSAATDPAQWDALAFWSIGLLMSAAVLEIGAFLILVTFA
jgi:1,4-dihydroxy-2-naphthoate octaprenyltransferase